MLKTLKIKNFVLVEELELEFSSGLNIISGETGAGKSVIVGALDIILGRSIKGNMLYDPSENASLEAVFSINEENPELCELIKEYSIDIENGELFFSRELMKQTVSESKDRVISFSSKSFINGRRVTNAIIKEFRKILIDFHSQRDQFLLLDEDYQLKIFDSFTGLETEISAYKEIFEIVRHLKSKLESLIAAEKKNKDKLTIYEYQLSELEDLKLKPGEDRELERELDLLNNAEEIIATCQEIQNSLYEQESSVYDTLNYFKNRLLKFENDSNLIKESVEEVQSALYAIDSVSSKLRNLKDNVELDSEKLEIVSDRLDIINSVKNKYKGSIEDILLYYKKIKDELDNFSSQKEIIVDYIEKLAKKLKSLYDSSKQLSKIRKNNSENFSRKIENSVRELAIPEAKFLAKISEEDIVGIDFDKFVNEVKDDYEKLYNVDKYLSSFSISGINTIDFLFSANKGIEMQSMKNAISGGELSRLLLSIKKILSDIILSQTIIFDEIDVGIGGKTANVMGSFIYEISKKHQVICITHLPQVASFADNHFYISKVETATRTSISVKKLGRKEILGEIARMLSGGQSALALEHAKELLNTNKPDPGQ